jgi:ABC-type multidrug transport system ATPase subunit
MRIELDDITKRFGRTTALDAVKLDIEPGSIVVVLGENGAGKSTLLRILGALCVPGSGTVRYDGERFDRERLDQRRRLLFTSDVPVLFHDQTIVRNVATFLHLYGRELAGRESEIAQLMEQCRIAGLSRKIAGTLSRGQFWKVALACVAAVRPELWLVDEPFASGMDAMGLGTFRRLARSLADQEGTVIYTTQMVELAAEFSDRVCVLREGRVVLWERSDVVRQMLKDNADGAEAVLRGLRKES